MRTRLFSPKYLVLIALILPSLCLSSPTVSIAETLPKDGPEILARILSAKEFQPRREDPSAMDRISNNVKEWLSKLVKKWREAFSTKERQGDRISWPILDRIGRAILAFCELFAASFPMILGMAIALLATYMGFRFLLNRASLLPSTTEVASIAPKDVRFNSQTIRKMLSSGETLKALDYLREILRDKYLSLYSLRKSKTDREILKDLPLTDVNHTTFANISHFFELAAFCPERIDKNKLNLALEEVVIAWEARS